MRIGKLKSNNAPDEPLAATWVLVSCAVLILVAVTIHDLRLVALWGVVLWFGLVMRREGRLSGRAQWAGLAVVAMAVLAIVLEAVPR